MEKNPSFINHNFRIVRLVHIREKVGFSGNGDGLSNCRQTNVRRERYLSYLAEFDRILTLQSGGSQSGRPFHLPGVLTPEDCSLT